MLTFRCTQRKSCRLLGADLSSTRSLPILSLLCMILFLSVAAAAENVQSNNLGGQSNEDQQVTVEKVEDLSETTPQFKIEIIDNLKDLKSIMMSGDENENEDDQKNETNTTLKTVPSLWAVLIHQSNLAVSEELRQIFEGATKSLHTIFPLVRVAMIPVQPSSTELLESLGISSVPEIILIRRQQQRHDNVSNNNDDTKEDRATNDDSSKDESSSSTLWSIQYQGSKADEDFLMEGLRHYYSRLAYSNIVHRKRIQDSSRYLESFTWSVQNQETLESMIRSDYSLIFPDNRSNNAVKNFHPLDPLLSEEEKKWIRSKIPSSSIIETNWLVSECDSELHSYTSTDDEKSLKPEDAESMGALSAVLASHHRVLFARLSDCPGVTCSVSSNDTINTKISIQRITKEDDDRVIVHSKFYVDDILPTELIARILRPSVLWFDRQATAPIAFAPYHTTHAVLVIDFDLSEDKSTSQPTFIDEFGKLCDQYHFQSHMNTQKDLVCMIIPSTETRVLMTYGINIWSERTPDNLPVLFLTNRTETRGVQRYYLDEPSGKMEDFIHQFFEGNLTSELWSRSHRDKSIDLANPISNVYGVVEWSSFHHAHHLGRHKVRGYVPKNHTLMMTYAPTCGHCKRLSVIWNELGRLVRHVKWDNWLQISRLDVTQEEFTAFGAILLPSVYYYHEPTKNMTWMNTGIEVGALQDPVQIIAWLLDVGVGLHENDLIEDLATKGHVE